MEIFILWGCCACVCHVFIVQNAVNVKSRMCSRPLHLKCISNQFGIGLRQSSAHTHIFTKLRNASKPNHTEYSEKRRKITKRKTITTNWLNLNIWNSTKCEQKSHTENNNNNNIRLKQSKAKQGNDQFSICSTIYMHSIDIACIHVDNVLFRTPFSFCLSFLE